MVSNLWCNCYKITNHKNGWTLLAGVSCFLFVLKKHIFPPTKPIYLGTWNRNSLLSSIFVASLSSTMDEHGTPKDEKCFTASQHFDIVKSGGVRLGYRFPKKRCDEWILRKWSLLGSDHLQALWIKFSFGHRNKKAEEILWDDVQNPLKRTFCNLCPWHHKNEVYIVRKKLAGQLIPKQPVDMLSTSAGFGPSTV